MLLLVGIRLPPILTLIELATGKTIQINNQKTLVNKLLLAIMHMVPIHMVISNTQVQIIKALACHLQVSNRRRENMKLMGKMY